MEIRFGQSDVLDHGGELDAVELLSCLIKKYQITIEPLQNRLEGDLVSTIMLMDGDSTTSDAHGQTLYRRAQVLVLGFAIQVDTDPRHVDTREGRGFNNPQVRFWGDRGGAI